MQGWRLLSPALITEPSSSPSSSWSWLPWSSSSSLIMNDADKYSQKFSPKISEEVFKIATRFQWKVSKIPMYTSGRPEQQQQASRMEWLLAPQHSTRQYIGVINSNLTIKSLNWHFLSLLSNFLNKILNWLFKTERNTQTYKITDRSFLALRLCYPTFVSSDRSSYSDSVL